MNFFVTISLVLLFKFLLRFRIHLPHVLFVMTEIIFVATEILLLLVVNSECLFAIGFSFVATDFSSFSWFMQKTLS